MKGVEMPSKRWLIAPGNPRLEEQLATALQLHPVAARLLTNRGITSIEGAREFLNPALQQLYDPCLMHGMPQAVERLACGLRAREAIAIYGLVVICVKIY